MNRRHFFKCLLAAVVVPKAAEKLFAPEPFTLIGTRALTSCPLYGTIYHPPNYVWLPRLNGVTLCKGWTEKQEKEWSES